jgi:hypothetical protein
MAPLGEINRPAAIAGHEDVGFSIVCGVGLNPAVPAGDPAARLGLCGPVVAPHSRALESSKIALT